LESGRIAIGISMLDGWTFGDDWQEFKPRAEETKAQTLAAMRALHEATKAREDEAARLEQQRIENERVAAENARIAADLKRQQDAIDAARADAERLAEAQRKAQATERTQEGDNRDASAGQNHVAEGSSSPTGRGENVTTAAGASPVPIPEAQAPQQVLKAEPATADATDRVEPANTIPRVGAMGAGQAADAAPIKGHSLPQFAGVDPKFCPGSNPDNPQPYPDPFADLLAHLHAGINNDRFPSHPKPHKGWWDELKLLMAAAESAQ